MTKDEDWRSLNEESSNLFLAELQRELPSDHELFGESITVLERRFSQDDVLVSVAGREDVAVVHLTWSQKRELAGYPTIHWYPSTDAAHEARSDW